MVQKYAIFILEYPEAMPSASQGIADLFAIANQQNDQPLFSIHTLSPATPPNGVEGPGIIFIPPSMAPTLPTFSDSATLSLLQACHRTGMTVVAACAGVFWLANAGLLDGKQATTHWRLCQYLADTYPAIERVSSREIVVDQGDVVTAAGIYAFQDLVLHMIARLCGYAFAKQVADYCLLDLTGRMQAYYQRFSPDFSHGNASIIKAQRFCAKHLNDNPSTLQIAQHCHLSERTLLRRFKRITQYSPKQYLIQLRVEKAKLMMELESISIEEIGHQLGYSDTSNFIKAFKRISGLTPAEFRARLGSHSG